MAYFFRLVQNAIVRRIAYLLVGLALGFVSQCAQAFTYQTAGMATQTTPKVSCEAFDAVSSAQDWFWEANATWGICKRPSGQTTPISQIGSCPTPEHTISYSASTGEGTCVAPAPTCTPPQVLNTATNQCWIPPDCTDGKLLTSGTFSAASPIATYYCVGGCSAVFVGTAPTISCAFAGGVGSCDLVRTGRFNALGALCGQEAAPVTKPAPNPDSPENKCVASGQTFGTVNGVTVCVPIGTAGSPVPPPLPDATKSKTVTNADGSTTTTTTNNTVNNNGTVSTTTTITNTPAGGGTPTTTTTTKQQDKRGFCEENPTLQICKDSSFSGSCTGSFTCNGDAIQCAIAKEQHTRNCKFFEEDADMNSEFETMKAGENNNPADVENREIVDVQSQLNESSEGIASSCPVDVNFSVSGHTFTLPMSEYCDVLTMLGYISLALAYGVAARILAGSV